MLKVAKVLRNQPILSLQAKSITNKRGELYVNGTQQRSRLEQIVDVNLYQSKFAGVLKMNREHRFNTLTPNYVKNLSRGLETLNIDENVKFMLLHPQNEEHFSNGTDFRTILHYKGKKQDQQIAQYLQDLYGLQNQIGKLNKPLMTIAPGHSYNSGASLLQASSLPVVTFNSKIQFNEVEYGFTPHGGSSFYLSRLAGEIGTFLALTGMPITGIDACRFNIAEKLVPMIKGIEDDVQDILDSMNLPQIGPDLTTDKFEKRAFLSNLEFMDEKDQFRQEELVHLKNRKKKVDIYSEDFVEPKDSIPSLTAESDFKYKSHLKKLSDDKYKLRPGYFDTGVGDHIDYFSNLMEHVKHHYMNFAAVDHRADVAKNLDVINRCFYPNTVEEIMELLKLEDSDFAKQCLKRMENNSMLSMKLALKMVRDARNKDIKGAMETEITVALNKIQDSEFDMGVKEVLLKGKKERTAPAFSKQVSTAQVESYFQPPKNKYKVELGIVENALLPNRFYYRKYPDQVRLFINEETTPQPEVREYFNYQLQEALRTQGIDLRNRAMTIEKAREMVYDQEKMQRTMDVFSQRVSQFSNDKILTKRINNEVKTEIDNLEKDEEKLFSLVNSKIQKIFEDAYKARLQLVYDKSTEVQNLVKNRMLLRLKKFFFKSRILQYTTESLDRNLNQAKSMPFKEIHLTEDWDKSFRDMQHPDLKQSFLWHLGKAVKNINLSPPELVKKYLTSHNTADLLKSLTIDKDQLLKLRKDILENTSKYEELFSRESRIPQGKNGYIEKDKQKLDEYLYWYRVLNEGRCPLDSLPYYHHFELYKEFIENLHKKSVNSLLLTINSLLKDFNSKEGLIEFQQHNNESKHQAILRLASLINQQPEQQGKKKRGSSQQKNSQLKSIIKQDDQLSKIFQTQDREVNNQVTKMKSEFFNELSKLVEVVLLKNEQVSQNILEERLKAKPQQDHLESTKDSLYFIDEYLKNQNYEQKVTAALEIVKPYFFQMIKSRLDEESRGLLNKFDVNETFDSVYLYYNIHLQFPQIRNSEALEKFLTFNPNRFKLDLYEKAFPQISRKSKFKQFLASMNELHLPSDFSSLKIEDKEELMDQRLNEKLDQLDAQIQQQEAIEEELRQQSFENYEKTVGEPSIEDNDYKSKVLALMTEEERNEVSEISKLLEKFEKDFEQNESLILNNLKIKDFLHIYSSAILDYGFKFDSQDEISLEEITQNGIKNTQNFDSLAHACKYMEEIYEALDTNVESTSQNQEELYRIIAEQMNDKQFDIDAQVNIQQIFDSIQKSKHNSIKDLAREELKKDFKNLVQVEEQAIKMKRSKENLTVLSKQMSGQSKQQLQEILENESPYVNYQQLENHLINNNLAFPTHHHYLQLSQIPQLPFQDKLHQIGHKLTDTLREKLSTVTVDVTSLNQFMAQIKNDQELKKFLPIIMDINNQLQYLDNGRRKQISLLQFLQKNYQVSFDKYSEFSTNLITTKVEKLLGKTQDLSNLQDDLQDVSFINWEFAGVKTNPATQAQEDEKDQRALNELEDNQTRDISSEIKSMLDIKVDSKLQDQVIAEAQQLTELSPSFRPIKSLYENKVIDLYSRPEFNEKALEEVITQYSEARIKECFLNLKFTQRVNSNNGHIYIQVLKERVLDELNLSQASKLSEFSYENTKQREGEIGDSSVKFDLGSKYNTNHINNQEALGYDNFDQRLGNQDRNRELAQESPFDKLIANYFLEKRSDIKKGQQLAQNLNKLFKLKGLPSDHPSKTANKHEFDSSEYPFPNTDALANLAFTKVKQSIDKSDKPSIDVTKMADLMELDIIVQQALEDGKNGLSDRLRSDIPKEMKTIPEYFSALDQRKPAKQWVEDKLEHVLKQVFEARSKVEKIMSRSELVAFDQMIVDALTKENIIQRIRYEMDSDFDQLAKFGQQYQNHQENTQNDYYQTVKMANYQDKLNQELRLDEDAFYKLMTYAGMLQKKNTDNKQALLKDMEKFYDVHSFENFYMQELIKGPRTGQKPRTVDPEEFQPKKGKAAPGEESQGFMNALDREKNFYDEYQFYKENKKEQFDRISLFYILEQKHKEALEKDGPLDKAQEELVNYFKDPANTKFYEKNKIQ